MNDTTKDMGLSANTGQDPYQPPEVDFLLEATQDDYSEAPARSLQSKY